jgi:hypothetical protein
LSGSEQATMRPGAQTYPTRPITVIVPYAVGSVLVRYQPHSHFAASDPCEICRLLSQMLS